MSRTRIVKGKTTEIIGGDYSIYSLNGDIVEKSQKLIIEDSPEIIYGKYEKYTTTFSKLKRSNYKLESSFALEQLFYFAEKDSMIMFYFLMVDIFGRDIPIEAYEQLYKDASDKKSSINPQIIVVKKLPGSFMAAYYMGENEDFKNKILVSEYFIDFALKNNEKSQMLMLALVEEFGHHLDYLLRYKYSSIGGDAIGDEGAKYTSTANKTYNKFFIDPFEKKEQPYARLTIKGKIKQLVWDFSDIHLALKEYVDNRIELDDNDYADYEFFSAGKGNSIHGFGHRYIENKAFESIKWEEENEETLVKDQIYLGNWLRDYSQFVDPMVIRPMANILASDISQFDYKKISEKLKNLFDENKLRKGNNNCGCDIKVKKSIPTDFEFSLFPPNFSITKWDEIKLNPVKFSRATITNLVGYLALKEFGEIKIKEDEKGNKKPSNYFKYIEKFRSRFIYITPEILGVYRPEEHIDNPYALIRKSGEKNVDNKLDCDFVKDPIDAQWDKNKTHGTRKYIRTDDEKDEDIFPFPTSFKCFKDFINKSDPNSVIGRINFGAALHILEDYYAHSNFCELAVMKVYDPKVYPWDNPSMTSLKKTKNSKLKKGEKINYSNYYIQTGSFNRLDTIASILPKLNEHFFSITIKDEKEIEKGERTWKDAFIYEILKDISSAQDTDASESNPNYKGKKNDSYTKIYDKYLCIRDAYVEKRDFGFFGKHSYKDILEIFGIFNFLEDYIRIAKNALTHFLILSATSLIDDYQTFLYSELLKIEDEEHPFWKLNEYGPSHTQLAKDSGLQPLHGLAIECATEAVTKVLKIFLDKKKTLEDKKTEIINIVGEYMQHPIYTDSMDDIVLKWCEKNEFKLSLTHEPSILLWGIKTSIDEIESFSNKIIETKGIKNVNISKINDIVNNIKFLKNMELNADEYFSIKNNADGIIFLRNKLKVLWKKNNMDSNLLNTKVHHNH